MPRIPFAEAISEKLLFKTSFDGLSAPQQTILKIIYGLSLSSTELAYWHAFNGGGQFDDLGYLKNYTEVLPYVPREYTDITLIVGRRSGKTSAISSFVVAYEALCGGHKEYLGTGSRQDPVFLQVAQDLDTAKANLRQFILDLLEKSPIGKQQLGDIKLSVTADTIRLRGCGRITVGPPTLKLRGQAIAVCAMDELAVWPKDRDSAAPDMEVERAVIPAMLQFPFKKLIKTSTPMTEEGLLWKAAEIGTQGRLIEYPDSHSTTLVLRAPTAALQNPILKEKELKKEREKDLEAFKREFLALFAKSVSGYLSPELLRQSVEKGITRRPPRSGVIYVGALDPAFRKDSFAFAIGHMEGQKFILDVIESWRGTKDLPISPTVVLSNVARLCREYNIKSVLSDQYHLESLQELAFPLGLSIEPLIFNQNLKKIIWGEFSSLLNQGRMSLLDHHDLLEECMGMERHLTPAGAMQIYGRRDDLATAVVICLHRVLQYGEKASSPVEKLPVTHAEQFWDHFHKTQRRKAQDSGSPWWA